MSPMLRDIVKEEEFDATKIRAEVEMLDKLSHSTTKTTVLAFDRYTCSFKRIFPFPKGATVKRDRWIADIYVNSFFFFIKADKGVESKQFLLHTKYRDRQGKTAYFIRAFAYYAQFSLHLLRLQILHKRIKTRGLVTMIVVDSTHFMERRSFVEDQRRHADDSSWKASSHLCFMCVLGALVLQLIVISPSYQRQAFSLQLRGTISGMPFNTFSVLSFSWNF